MSRRVARRIKRPRMALGVALAAVAGTASTLLGGAPALAAGDSHESAYVFATREGLVGGTTANGHIIKPSDHFVSLPSRNGLSAKGSGARSVRVCLRGRCVYEPVWDVGPWNTRDTYWNDPREWPNLPTGVPEAQAAYQNGYNGGRDQFGRTVRNPGGLDLADGAMWDGLHGGDVAWVTVDYLWTGTGTQGQVRTAGGVLNVRNGASTRNANVGLAGPYAQVPIECQVVGQYIAGYVRATNLWDRVGPGNYISDAYVTRNAGVGLPRC
jgi:hypothetical protein